MKPVTQAHRVWVLSAEQGEAGDAASRTLVAFVPPNGLAVFTMTFASPSIVQGIVARRFVKPGGGSSQRLIGWPVRIQDKETGLWAVLGPTLAPGGTARLHPYIPLRLGIGDGVRVEVTNLTSTHENVTLSLWGEIAP